MQIWAQSGYACMIEWLNRKSPWRSLGSKELSKMNIIPFSLSISPKNAIQRNQSFLQLLNPPKLLLRLYTLPSPLDCEITRPALIRRPWACSRLIDGSFSTSSSMCRFQISTYLHTGIRVYFFSHPRLVVPSLLFEESFEWWWPTVSVLDDITIFTDFPLSRSNRPLRNKSPGSNF